MDTDDLTEMAYQSIVMADRITEYLKCDLGVRSMDYEDEDAYLHGILNFVREIKTDPEAYLDSWNLLDDIDLDAFVKGIEGLEKHILKTIETPLGQRGDTW
ncbi:MAG: hypothetical protein ABII26_06400 [Pseudomonadota bacterium]